MNGGTKLGRLAVLPKVGKKVLKQAILCLDIILLEDVIL